MTDTEQINNISAKPDIRFEASQTTVIAGASIVLSWIVTRAQRVFVNSREVAHNGEQIETIEEDTKFKLEVNGKGLFADHKKIVAIKVPQPVISSIEFVSATIREKTPVILRLALQYCSHWKLEVAYLTNNRLPEVVATGNNETRQSEYSEEVEVFLKAACSLVLTIFNGKKEASSRPYYLDTAKPIINDFTTDKLIIAADGTVRLNWKTEHHHKLLIQPGNYDVSNDLFLDYKPANTRDVTVTLIAYGDFGQQASRSLQIRVAWLGHHTTSNNGNASNPEFFLEWDSAYIEHVTLNPGGVSVPATAKRFPISGREETGDYYLQGATITGEIVKYPFTLYAADILFFEASRTSAIIGTKLYLRWRVTNARRVTLSHGIGSQTGQEEVIVIMQQGMETITITVWGDINIVTQSLYIPLLKGPEITRIKIPLLELKVQLSLHGSFIPNRSSSLLPSSLLRRYEKIHPLIRKMLLPSTAAKQLFMRRRLREFQQFGLKKENRLVRSVRRQVNELLSEFRSLLQKTKIWRIWP